MNEPPTNIKFFFDGEESWIHLVVEGEEEVKSGGNRREVAVGFAVPESVEGNKNSQ